MELQRLLEFAGVSESSDLTGNGFTELEPHELCYIDDETARALELVQNNVDVSNRKHSLFGYLNANTCTTSGTRLIRQGIMAPPCHLPTIENRLDCIEYLINRIDTLSNITNCIRRFGQGIDLDSVVNVLVNLFKTQSNTLSMAEKRMEAISTVETLLSQITVLKSALEGSDQPTLNYYKIALCDPAYADMLNEIHNVIESDVKTGKSKRGRMFRIRQGVESLFDIARSTYNAAVNDLEQYARELHKEDGLPWKLNYGESRGYYLTLSLDNMPKNYQINPRYIRVNKTRKMITCTTVELMQSNVRANVSYENSMKLANEILSNTLASVTSNISAIHKLVDIVGTLDMLTSFAKLVSNSNGALVRPRFTATDTIVAKSRHPVLESVLSVNDLTVVPNDIRLSSNNKNFMLVTGPNMGGKSIFLKQVALIQIMAQLGCYVPAESAHIKPMDRIVVRTGTSDDIHSNCSSFMWEMKGIASALQEDKGAQNDNILYIIDEVGRGTSIDDGASYSFAIAEELAMRRNCFTIFATHFDQVFYLASLYGNVIAYHFKYEAESCFENERSTLKINHSLLPGIAEKNHYGIRLAAACGLPDEILQLARRDLGL